MSDYKGKAIMSIEEEPEDEQLMDEISDNDDDDDGSDMYDPEGSESEYEFEEPPYVDPELAALQAKFDAEDLPAGAEASVPWLEDQKPTPDPMRPPVPCSSSTVPKQFVEDDNDEAILKYRSFKSFDTVEDFSDHHYQKKSVTKKQQASSEWAKAIQQDWRLLGKDLPDTIFVRAYEGRMDLLRAVIVGAAGTPYHDGLFFFDVYFPSHYPNTPPLVNYHAHGLRLNPNLYDCGKVCLSLLNTWQGQTNECWIPKESTMLQVLLSIQALVLNEKPYFNEPGYEEEAGTVQGERIAQEYNESTFILSCRTMMYTLKNPPKYFEDYVIGHFRLRGQFILAACKAYIEGAQVGCAVEEEVQDDANEGEKSDAEGAQDVVKKVQQRSTSLHFKSEVGTMAGNLVPVFLQNGAKNCEQYICLGDSYRLAEANYTNIFKKDFFKKDQDQVADPESQAQASPQPFAHSSAHHFAHSNFGHGQTYAHAYGNGATNGTGATGAQAQPPNWNKYHFY
ncbi:hypothetical protein MKW94_029828 [Papaver nudicaule]|uniref:E2 ubiquitin-conjugating enzyme n=1 Tax=Papaver nudicaule TaxID=74823 RepID=A0AA41V2B0_PAPNU|nr:hypothetical protein [Papaver nudicaule]